MGGGAQVGPDALKRVRSIQVQGLGFGRQRGEAFPGSRPGIQTGGVALRSRVGQPLAQVIRKATQEFGEPLRSLATTKPLPQLEELRLVHLRQAGDQSR